MSWKQKKKERRKELAEEPATTEISGGKGEVKPENEINIGSNTGSYVTEEKPNPYLLQ